MSKLTRRDSNLLARVQALSPGTLHQLILSRGLEACADIVAAATAAQLTSLLDMDLWRPAPGRDEQFDADRFGEWLEVLADHDPSTAARTLAALDRDVVVEGLSRYVRVFDPGIFEPTAQSDDEAIDRHDAMLEGGGGVVECELGGYLVRARRTDAWDAVIALLVALDAEYPDDFHAMMRGCRTLSNSDPEASGFHDLLLAQDQHLHDVTIERERRRSQQGYATSAEARAFLAMARHAPAGSNPLVAAYFRAADEVEESSNAAPPLSLPPGPSGTNEVTDEDVLLARSRELAFLANALLAGCSVQSRPFTPREASDAAAAICNLGLEYWPTTSPETLRSGHNLVTAFEVGWSVLHTEVTLFATDHLIATLADLHRFDPDVRLGLAALRRALVKQRDAGTPWRARDQAEILATLDTTAWVAVAGLLGECPVVPAALTAILDGCTTTVSQTEFEFISTAAQIAAVHRFMHRLAGVLSR